MTSSFTVSVKDNVQHNFNSMLKELKADKYLLINETIDSEWRDPDVHGDPSFSFGFYTELKDVLTYIIDHVRKNLDIYVDDRYEDVIISKKTFKYTIGDDDVSSITKIFVGNLKEGDEKIICSAFEKINVKIKDAE